MDIFSEASSGSSGTNPFAGSDPSSVPFHSILTLNIQSAVPTLELVPPNYTLWLSFMNALLQSFAITDHVDGSVDARSRRSDPIWTQIDWCIIRWLYGSVSKDIAAAIRVDNPTAYILWTAIRTLFLSNRTQQGVHALEEFHSLFQGHLSIQEYCTRLKTIADTLADCGLRQDDKAIVTNMIRGLSRKFDHAVAVLTYDETKQPTFLQARTYLLREESRLTHLAAHDTATALYAGRAPAPPAPPAPAPAPPQAAPPSGGQRGRKRRKGTNGGGPPPPAAPAAPPRQPAPAASPVFNPWTGTFQAWPVQQRPPGTGVLGPRPAAFRFSATGYGAPSSAPGYGAPPSALGYGVAPSPTGYGAFPPAQYGPYSPVGSVLPAPAPAHAPTAGNPWETPALQHALLSMQQQPYSGGGDWFLDT
ncbi:vacuolar protein sorting-associated protein 37C [Triticum aestivum]|uniref:vacuolar protein sorting-associated protein 37C n=1 Tax=Triticum aestivum TaxID=4565 RepID=UPI001D02B072|nr:vacuolar protein sorting-associated protein 37C-like [Triticum aestivum]